MRRAISEIISTIIIISVVASGLGIYTGLSQQRILGDTLSVKEAIEQRDEQISELIQIIGMYRHETQPDVIQVFVHNYGLKNITIQDIFVNGTLQMSTGISNPVYVRDLQETVITPKNKTLPQGKTSEIILNFTGNISLTDGIKNIVIQTESNKLVQVLNDTG
jgi:hypothetical protein